MGINGIDISEAQGNVSFGHVKASGKAGFVYAKATEGVTLTDAKFKEYFSGCLANNIPFGAYHFFHFTTSQPIAQANHFLATIFGHEGSLLPMVDVERASEPNTLISARDAIGRLGAFVDTMDAKLRGKKMLIYTGYSFWQDALQGSDSFAGHPLWVAAYCAPPAPVPTGWSKSTMWQHTDNYSVPGFDHPVDGDILLSGVLPEIMR